MGSYAGIVGKIVKPVIPGLEKKPAHIFEMPVAAVKEKGGIAVILKIFCQRGHGLLRLYFFGKVYTRQRRVGTKPAEQRAGSTGGVAVKICKQQSAFGKLVKPRGETILGAKRAAMPARETFHKNHNHIRPHGCVRQQPVRGGLPVRRGPQYFQRFVRRIVSFRRHGFALFLNINLPALKQIIRPVERKLIYGIITAEKRRAPVYRPALQSAAYKNNGQACNKRKRNHARGFSLRAKIKHSPVKSYCRI